MQKTRRRNPSVVLTSVVASISVCHFFTIDRSLSVVRFIPWKLVSTLCPWTSSEMSLNFRKDLSASLSLCKSANDTSNTRPFNPSEAISIQSTRQTWDEIRDDTQFKSTYVNNYLLVPWVRFTKVFPTCRVLKIDGAFTSYQSFRVKGSMLKEKHFIWKICTYWLPLT